jgi:hypothetical protein
MLIRNVVLASLLLVTLGCAEDDDTDTSIDEQNPTTAPSISDLSYTPTTLVAGQQNVVNGSFAFEDPDADVLALDIEFVLPDGRRQALPTIDVQDSAGQVAGTIALALLVIPPVPGDYGFSLWLTDSTGDESNRLEGTARAD